MTKALATAPATARLIAEAYRALMRQDLVRAVQLVYPISQAEPDNLHPWLILGGAALERAEAATAHEFFARALSLSPEDPLALGGMGKAHVLAAEPAAALPYFAAAIHAGSDDVPMARLYRALLQDHGHELPRGAVLIAGMARRLRDPALLCEAGEALTEALKFTEAAEAFELAHSLDPEPLRHRLGRLKALVVRADHAAAVKAARAILADVPDCDEAASLLAPALRHLGRPDEVMALLDRHFSSPIYYQRLRAVTAHVHLDRGEEDAARIAFTEALHISPEQHVWASTALSAFHFCQGDFARGLPHYLDRHPRHNRRRIPAEAALPENITTQRRLFVMEEQGIGDQLAHLPLIRLAPVAAGCTPCFVGDARMKALLAGNTLGLGFIDESAFDPAAMEIARGEVVFLGDLARYLPKTAEGLVPMGGYLRADAERREALRARYRHAAGDGPVIGLAWRSGDALTGARRSIALRDLAGALPAGALAVNLQYGDVAAEWAEAAALRPDVHFLIDETVDQMRDLAGFTAQIMALDRILTIDNTTAHAAGALGHRDTHVLVPAGAECMWYWGRRGTADRWYGCLHLHRQGEAGRWDAPLQALARIGA